MISPFVIKIIFVDNTPGLVLVIVNVRLKRMLFLLYFFHFLFGNLIRSQLILKLLMSEIKDNIFFGNVKINQKEIKY